MFDDVDCYYEIKAFARIGNVLEPALYEGDASGIAVRGQRRVHSNSDGDICFGSKMRQQRSCSASYLKNPKSF